jgi:hypothetical protein
MEKKYLIIDKIIDILDEQNQLNFEDYLINSPRDIFLDKATDTAEKIILNLNGNETDEFKKNILNLKAETEKIFYFDTTEIKKLIADL